MNLHPLLQQGLKHGVYWITERIAIGQYPTIARFNLLQEQGVTHILCVADADPPDSTGYGFRQVTAVPIEDLQAIEISTALTCVDHIHTFLSESDSKLYIHCVAGQNRSPTILWFFLLATGMDADEARRLIVSRCPDAVPGHGALVGDVIVEAVREHGGSWSKPLDRGITAPAY